MPQDQTVVVCRKETIYHWRRR